MQKLFKFLAWPVLISIKFYQIIISPHLPQRCRFYPSCSVYAAEALKKHGLIKGSALSIRRILRCRPGKPGGYDPVP
ncbi:MAG: membrane protein insertion efficiency factor YidD [Spirochaeta sp. LUC14_002_19_P3]|nr:MAG: membrane protein insertion efficiency factor YidD [Spirochaeta sp. LUC14_002_19_P3]